MSQVKSNKAGILIVLAVLCVAAGFGYTSMQSNGSINPDLINVPVFQVKQGPLKISVVESGTIRPRDEVILRNDTDDDTTIVSIIAEGAEVKKGDLIAVLDASAKEERLVAQQLDLQNDEAELISSRENLDIVRNQAQSDIEKAELLFKFSKQDLKKYLKGEYPKQIKEAEVAITLASQEYALAKDDLKWSEVLFKKKYLAESELQQDELSAKRAELDLDLAREDFELLKNYTHIRQLDQLNSDVKQNEMESERTKSRASANIVEASARYFWRQERVQRQSRYVRELETEIKAAKIYAPIDGLALYASSVIEDWEDDEDRIRVGALVDEEREIIFLTAAKDYNIDILIQETDLNKIKQGQPAKITVDALPGANFVGVVNKVSHLPNQRQQYLNPNLKVYSTDIEIQGESESLRNGMSCMVEIVVEEYENAVYAPIQAVVKVNGVSTVFVRNDNTVEARPVTIGLDNNSMVHIKEGLSEGEYVLLKPPLNFQNEDESNATAETIASLTNE
ncbi:MAG: HlyD family efflux transporter periplasmic adaptor subunit [Candidatus Hinthialibacter antarcticus]|nr:HlyD family efflux transporter periplasmic adaptor subunit [Candidatus Hinthialibacter antarcticus]